MIRRLVALLLALWFPVQALASLGMPYCAKHGSEQPSADSVAGHHHRSNVSAPDCHEPVAMPAGQDRHADHHAASAGAVGDDLGAASCDQCGLCHLACAGYLPGDAVRHAFRGESVFFAREPHPARSYQPDLFDRPPLTRPA